MFGNKQWHLFNVTSCGTSFPWLDCADGWIIEMKCGSMSDTYVPTCVCTCVRMYKCMLRLHQVTTFRQVTILEMWLLIYVGHTVPYTARVHIHTHLRMYIGIYVRKCHKETCVFLYILYASTYGMYMRTYVRIMLFRYVYTYVCTYIVWPAMTVPPRH